MGNPIAEVMRAHSSGQVDRKKERETIIGLMRKVGIPSPEMRINDYAYQISGGMEQRIMIAIALACRPDILIADEPTTALDVTVQAQVLELIKDLKDEFSMSVILISHNLGIVANMCDRILVMYGGVVVEEGSCYDIFKDPRHPYTRGLLMAIPSLKDDKEELFSIPGTVPTFIPIRKDMRVVLASASPRRREILDQIGIKYDVCVSSADENTIEKDPKKLVSILSERKALAVLKSIENGTSGLDADPETETFCVIGCDTIVYQENGNGILGKPRSEGEAFEMLSSLAGGVHDVYSGVTILVSGLKTPVKRQFWERTSVHFAEMSDEEIMEYIRTGDPMDKAGAYGIQGFCARYIEGIDGDYLNVVGLPACHLYKELKSLGVV